MMGMMPMGGMPQMGMGGMPAGGGGPPEGQLTGEIKNWNDEKGFGFVVPSGGGDDIFCHRTDIISTGDRPQLARGMQVSYEVGSGRDGRARATEVANVDGTPIAEGAAMQMGGGGGSVARTGRDVQRGLTVFALEPQIGASRLQLRHHLGTSRRHGQQQGR